jgi:2-haloacid dehalogenase
MRKFSEVEIITFDVYGTLVDWRYSIGSFIAKYVSRDAVEEYFECDIKEVSTYRLYKDILKTCLRKIMDRRGLSYRDELGDAFVRAFAKSPPFPDTIYGLYLLKKKGYRTGVISNTDRDLIEVTLYGLRELIDYIVTAQDTGFYKPDPRAFTRALEIMGVSKEKILHVSAYPQYDLETAERLSIKNIHLNRYGYKWSPEIRSLDELADLLSSE